MMQAKMRMRRMGMGWAGIAGIAAMMGLAACGGSEQAPQNPAPGAAMTADTRAADEEAIRAADAGVVEGGGR